MVAPRENLIRNMPFEVTRASDTGDGLTLEGYAAVFDSPTEIASRQEGHFIERMKPGCFRKTLDRRTPVLMFNHGQHPLIGDMPLGVITEAREDARGLFVKARLSDNWLIQPVRDAIELGAVSGMSFRMSIPQGKETWRKPAERGGLPERDIHEVACPELGPVVFPAYEDTTVGVRSQEIVDQLADPDVLADLSRALFMSERAAGDSGETASAYADPGYKDDKVKRYPINTAAHVKAAWAYINMPKNDADYSATQLASIKSRIKTAAKRFGIDIADSEMPSTMTKSADLDGESRTWMMSDLCSIVEDAIEDQLYEDDYVCVVDVSSDGNAYFCVWESGEMETYEIPFTIDEAGAVTLGTPTEVLKKTTYVPATSDEAAESTSDEAGRSTETETAEPTAEVTPGRDTNPKAATDRFKRQLLALELGV
jgi:HK97 family phage prohead protease